MVNSVRMQPLQKLSSLLEQVKAAGFAFISSASLQAWLLARSPDALSDWAAFSQSWHDMPLDEFMADGGRYRRRRYAVFSTDDAGTLQQEPHQPHYQSLAYNTLNGGVAREFAPILPETCHSKTMQAVLGFCQRTFSQLVPHQAWHIEVHQFRIEAGAAVAGKPTPEGVHRDGVDFVLVMMVRRENISSGTTTMHDLEQNTLDSFTLTEPLDCALVNDARCMHGVTPIEPVDPEKPAYRDVLVVTFRRK